MVLMVMWLRKVLKANTPQMWCAVGGLLTESFFLVNYRQPMFWMILLYADVTMGKLESGQVEPPNRLLRIRKWTKEKEKGYAYQE